MVSVVIPTYQERENIEPLLDRLGAVAPHLGEPLEIVVVDSHSEDGTVEVARAWFQRTSLGRVVQLEHPLELASAVLYGIRQASGDVVAAMDADLSHPPELLPALVDAIRQGRCEVAVASRYVRGGRIARWPWRRRVLSRLGNAMAWPLVRIADATSGYFACRRAALNAVAVEPRGFKILLEILVKGCLHQVEEVPYQFTDRQAGISKLDGRVLARYLTHLARLYWHRRRHPCRHTDLPFVDDACRIGGREARVPHE